MTFSELEESEDVVDVGRDMEFWTNGELTRFGIDVVSGKCVEVSLIEIGDFCKTVDRESFTLVMFLIMIKTQVSVDQHNVCTD